MTMLKRMQFERIIMMCFINNYNNAIVILDLFAVPLVLKFSLTKCIQQQLMV